MKRFSPHRVVITICLVFCLAASAAQAQTGCSLSGGGTLPGTPLAGNLNAPIDQAILETAAELSQLLGVDPAVFYLQESEGPNAFATPRRFPSLLAAEGRPYDGPDGTVLIGLQLISSEWQATSGTGLSLPAIEAHEFAHIAQFKYGFPYQGKWRELHADFIAGWYTAHSCRSKVCNPYQAMANFFYKGGGDHGTSSERQAAFVAGFNLNVNGNIASGTLAYQYGIEYIKSL